MTTITTGTSGPKAWKIALVAGAVGLAGLVAVNLPQTTSDTTSQQVAATAAAPLPEAVTGFEYNNESTAGQVASPGVTTQYLGNSGELFPYENGSAPLPETVSGFEYTNESTAGQAVSPGVTTQYTGNSGELFPYENGPASEATSQITQEFFDGPSSGADRVDPRAAVAAGLSPGAIDAIVGGSTQVAPTPDNLADAQARESVGTQPQTQTLAAADEALVIGASEAPFNSAPYVAYTEGMSEAGTSGAVDWDGLGGPYQDGTVADYYAQEIAQRSPQQNVSMR